MNKNSIRGLIQMFIVTLIWGSVPIVGVMSALPSAVFVFFRVLFALPFMFYFSLKKGSLKEILFPKPFWTIFISALMLGLNWVFFFWALQITDVANVVIIYYMGPFISLILAVIFLKEPLKMATIAALILALIGVFLSQNGDIIFNKATILAILAAFCYGLLGFFSKLATKNHSAIIVTNYQLIISTILTFPFLFLQEWHFSLNSFFIVIIAGVIHTALALFLWYDALHFIKVSTASILQYLDIFFSIFLAYIILNQIPSSYQIIGATLIVVSGIIVSIKES